MNNSELRLAALNFANEVIRKFDGTPQDEIAHGVPGETDQCALAVTIRNGLPQMETVQFRPGDRDVMLMTKTSEPMTLPASHDAVEFAIGFDMGDFPDLVETT